jgi:hypothetical protein
MKNGFVAALAALALSASAAHAATAIYTITGTADGSLNGVAFSNAAFTFTLNGDTANLTDDGSLQKLDPLDSSSVAIAGFAPVTLNIPTYISRLSAGTETAFNGVIGGNLRKPAALGHRDAGRPRAQLRAGGLGARRIHRQHLLDDRRRSDDRHLPQLPRRAADHDLGGGAAGGGRPRAGAGDLGDDAGRLRRHGRGDAAAAALVGAAG